MTKTNSKAVLSPPDGLSMREQARWWTCNPESLLAALKNGTISGELFNAIERAAKDTDLAMKIADREQVNGLTQEERGRLFSLLTDGGELGGPKKGAPSRALSDLCMAHAIKHITDPHKRKQELRKAIVAELGGTAEEDRIRKRIKRIEDLWRLASQFNPNSIEMLLVGLESNKVHDPDNPVILDQSQILWLLEVYSMFFEEGSTEKELPEINTPPL
ncbi:MAG: hypothetical protein CXR31_03265 [Geobacter sp.]|nr:MAG: hypothetical protein CXR31_03265 [Geobacter sp.]